jgi:SAM-dependent methyltransferase
LIGKIYKEAKNDINNMSLDEYKFEKENVIDIYNSIAYHFSNTRHVPWNKIKKIIKSFKSGTMVGDIGCGNGIYMNIRNDCFFRGCDVSKEFVKICKEKKLNVIEGNILNIPFENSSFDYVLNISVLPHLCTEERRLKAIKELIRITKPGGKIIIQVWAFEQKNKNYFTQDNMIPWHLQKKFKKNNDYKIENSEKLFIYNRFYHLFTKNELENLVSKINNIIIEESYTEKGNYGVIIRCKK